MQALPRRTDFLRGGALARPLRALELGCCVLGSARRLVSFGSGLLERALRGLQRAPSVGHVALGIPNAAVCVPLPCLRLVERASCGGDVPLLARRSRGG